MKKRSLIAIALGAWLSGAVWAQEKLTIGAWNIEWLGRADMRSAPSTDHPQTPEDVADYIRQSGVDLLSLEEICIDPGEEFERRNPTLDRAFQLLGPTWKYRLFPKKQGEPTQLTGIAWNTARVKALGTDFGVPVQTRSPDGFNLWKRAPRAMHFQAGSTDFVVIPLHLKSNRRDDRIDNPPKQRGQEARALARALPAVRAHFHDPDVILMGDTNVVRSQEAAIQALTGAGFRNLNGTDTPTTWDGHDPFDRIFLTPRFATSRLRIVKPAGWTAEEFKIRLSDHYMVTTDLDL